MIKIKIEPANLALQLIHSDKVHGFCRDHSRAIDLYNALCSNTWMHADIWYFQCTFKEAYEIVSKITENPDYRDEAYYRSTGLQIPRQEGFVTEEVKNLLHQFGWTLLPDSDVAETVYLLGHNKTYKERLRYYLFDRMLLTLPVVPVYKTISYMNSHKGVDFDTVEFNPLVELVAVSKWLSMRDFPNVTSQQ